MKVLVNENLDESFPALLVHHEASHVTSLGWKGIKNGALLALAGEAGFGALVTVNKNMPHQQNMRDRPFCLIVLDIHPNALRTQQACIPRMLEVLASAEPGRVYVIEGPHSRRRPSG